MPVFGLYIMAHMEGVARIHFPKSSRHWAIRVRKAQQKLTPEMGRRFRIGPPLPVSLPEESQMLTVSEHSHGRVEWQGLHGVDRVACDRKLLEGTVKLAKTRQGGRRSRAGHVRDPQILAATLGEYQAVGSDLALIALFECEGCEPAEWFVDGPIFVEDEDGRRFHVADFSGAWANGDGQNVCIIEHEFRLVY
jgi:hypothetical protein